MINHAPQADGVYLGFWGYGVLCLTCAIIVPNLKILVFSNSFHFLNIFVLIGSVFLFFISFFFINLIKTNDHYELFSK